MAFKTFTAGTLATASDINVYLMNQSIATFSSTTARNSSITSPVEGQVAYINSSDTFTYYTGTGWQNLAYGGNWTAFTPTGTGITYGNGVFDFAYAQYGKTVFLRGAFTLGTTSSVATNVSFNLPITGANANRQFGQAVYQQSSFHSGVAFMTGSTYLNFYVQNTSGAYGNLTAISGPGNIPLPWSTGHVLSFVITYQAA
jgi:hypothetical protein